MIKRLIKTTIIALNIALVACNIGSVIANEGDALLMKVDQFRAPSANFTFDLQLEAQNGKIWQLKVSIQNSTKGLVRYIKPAKVADRLILFVDQNMWVFVPGTRRALRISPQQRVLGGVSSADVARTNYSEDYQVTNISKDNQSMLLQLEPKTKSAAYGRIDLSISSSGAPQKAVFFAGGSRKLKTIIFGGYRDVLGVKRTTKLLVTDHLDGDAVTTMQYSNFKKTKTPASWYQPANMGRF